jgi:putative flippase GtrA
VGAVDDTALASPDTSPRASWIYRLSGVTGAGLAGWLVDVAVLWFSHDVLGVHPVVAAAAGFLAAGLTNFLLNRIVFAGQGGRTPRQALRYALLFGANLPVVSFGVPLVADAVHDLLPGVPAPLLVGKVVVTALLVPLNAWLYGIWVFKE